MIDTSMLKNDDERDRHSHIIELVKDVLQEARLFEEIVIEEQKEGIMLKPKPVSKEDKIKAFDSLIGSAISAGENVEELLKMANREESWRSKEVE